MDTRLAAVTLFALGTAAAQETVGLGSSPATANPMVFDLARDRVVQFTTDGEIFEYHRGARLHRINVGTAAPGPRSAPGLVYDPVRQHVLLFGGFNGLAALGDTWTWDGSAWTPRPSGPSPRGNPGMTFDTARNVAVMFGGSQFFGTGYAETWEHDGSRWIQRSPATNPGPSAARLAFDSTRGVTVMLAPSIPAGGPTATWEWNGIDWTLRNSGGGPSGLNGPAIAYDPVRQRTVVAGGGTVTVGNATTQPGLGIWEWDGNAWLRAATLSTPLRGNCCAWFDPTLGRLFVGGGPEPAGESIELAFMSWDGITLQSTAVDAFPTTRISFGWCASPGGALLFGGVANSSTAYGDTWLWNGSRWQLQNPAASPPARSEPAMALDLMRNASLLFGGKAADQPLADAWQWNGSTWTQLPPGPPARYGAAMACDLARSEIVLFGGDSSSPIASGALRNDTWTWNGQRWLQRFPVNSPTPRRAPAMAHDVGNAITLLLGGTTAASQLADTWQWNGIDWQLQNPTTQPPAMGLASAEYDWNRGHVQLEGLHATTSGIAEELWEWLGNDWILRTSVPLGATTAAPMARCTTTNTLIRCNSAMMRDWSDRPAEAVEYGLGCGTARLFVRARPRPGEPECGFELHGTPLQPCAFALDFAAGSSPLGGGCTLWLQGLANLWIAATDARGDAVLPLAAPFDPQLRAIPLFAQAAVLDPSQPSGFAVTAALRLRVGD